MAARHSRSLAQCHICIRRKARFFSTIELVNALEQEKLRGKTGQIAESLTKRKRAADPMGYGLS